MSDWPPKAAFKAEIEAYVCATDWVTFAQLHKRFAPEARESTQIELPGKRIVWSGLPQPMLEAILELLDEGVLASVPCHRSAYVADGRVLSLPVEKTIPPEGHAEPHWFPVILRPMTAVLAEDES